MEPATSRGVMYNFFPRGCGVGSTLRPHFVISRIFTARNTSATIHESVLWVESVCMQIVKVKYTKWIGHCPAHALNTHGDDVQD